MNLSERTQAFRRIEALTDENSFVEIGAMVTSRSTDFGLANKETPGDGVVTGYATIEGKLVFVYAQDAAALNGSLGEMHAKKIVKCMEMAMKMGAPVIGLADCSGLRLEEVTDALNGFGELFKVEAKASGVIPQIMGIFGKCGGGMAIAAGLSDFVYMENKAALFVNAPNTLDGNYKSKLDTASAAFQSENTGLVDGIGTEEEIIDDIRSLVAILPSNNSEMAVEDSTDDLNRLTEDLEGVSDVRDIAGGIADGGLFIETKKDYAKDVLTGFVRLDGVTVGVIGNKEAKISANGLQKAAGFLTFCDAFEIPVVTLAAVTGFKAEISEEKAMAGAAAKLAYAYANSDVPKISVLVGDCYGSAYAAFASKAAGADIVYAYENVNVGVMDAAMAAKILEQDSAKIPEVQKNFAEKQTALASARRGYVDEIVSAENLRKNVLIALEMLFNKREESVTKKHSAK